MLENCSNYVYSTDPVYIYKVNCDRSNYKFYRCDDVSFKYALHNGTDLHIAFTMRNPKDLYSKKIARETIDKRLEDYLLLKPTDYAYTIHWWEFVDYLICDRNLKTFEQNLYDQHWRLGELVSGINLKALYHCNFTLLNNTIIPSILTNSRVSVEKMYDCIHNALTKNS